MKLYKVVVFVYKIWCNDCFLGLDKRYMIRVTGLFSSKFIIFSKEIGLEIIVYIFLRRF